MRASLRSGALAAGLGLLSQSAHAADARHHLLGGATPQFAPIRARGAAPAYPRRMAPAGALCKEQGAQPRVRPPLLAANCAPPGGFPAYPPLGGERGSDEFQISPWLVDFNRAHRCSSQMLQHRPRDKSKSREDNVARDDRERWQAIDDLDHRWLPRSCLLSKEGRRALADGKRIRVSFWRRYGDYLEKHPSDEQCPDGGKAGVAFHAVGPHCQ